jgi:hypothetical protein
MSKKDKNVITISLVGLLLVVVVGVSYAFFTSYIVGAESESTIISASGKLVINYTEGDENITMGNAYPREKAWLTKTFTLTGTNTTELKMNYSVSLRIYKNTFSEGDLTYSLTSEEAESGSLIEDIDNEAINNAVGLQTIGYGYFATGKNVTHTYTLNIYFKDNGEDQTDSMGASFSGKIVVKEAESTEVLSPDGWDNAATGTLLAGIKTNYSNATETLTTPGKQRTLGTVNDATSTTMSISSTYQKYYWTYGTGVEQNADGTFNLTGVSTLKYSTNYSDLVGKYIVSYSDEASNSSSSDTTKTYTNLTYIVQVKSATSSSLTYKVANSVSTTEFVLSSAEDDYGTSYYFRGSVENNYVVFANMCWRIVRITGDGSIKLTLYNYNGDSVPNPCNVEGETLAFARYSGTTYTSAFNSSTGSNTYVGFMYGTASSSTYDAEHENLYDSAILTNLKTWYDASFNETQQSLLADTIWCNDKRVSSGTGIGTTETYYAAYSRTWKISTANPSLKCGDGKDDNKISKFTASDTEYGNGKLRGTNGVGDKEYKIGLLTADEQAFAGGVSIDKAYYLYKNTSSTEHYWLMSPNQYASSNARSFIGYNNGGQGWGNVSGTTNAIRPAIALNSTVKISSGNGTATNPFVIDES